MLKAMARNSARLAGTGMGWSGLCVVMIAVLAAGCAHARRAGAVGEMLPPKPPLFLDGPMAALLTNANGFSAHVVLETRPSSNLAAPVSGELLGRGGKLLFAPDESASGKKRRPGGGINFIWDVTAGSGYMLSEALQGYAPISSGVRVTNVVIGTGAEISAPEQVGGHPCGQEQEIVVSSDGSATVFQVWRALDLRAFAVRIYSATNATFFSLNLSSIRLETPSDVLFQPPAGFTKFDSAEAMMDELMARQQNLRRSATYTTGEPDHAGGREGRRGSGAQ